ncbi:MULTISPECIES: hypothetical protein [Gammaproteobacteria]|uniref:hypothetical protein n=1 Tax=Gammaproteobacteria TaxID=1236 RepID=UPI00273BC35C|nr:hypothetical protein [Marinobacter sp. MDS2]MDP4547379.1 hypothetical protein [Marinobacter sp. MDS2]
MISKKTSHIKSGAHPLLRSYAIRVIYTLALLMVFTMGTQAHSSDNKHKDASYFERQDRFQSIDGQRLRSLEVLFSEWLAAARSFTEGERIVDGFQVSEMGEGIQRLSDIDDRGWGHFFHASQRSSSTLLQAPHQFYDLRTGKIAMALFERGVGKALAMNSAHRYTYGKSLAETDWAHVPVSPLNAFTRAFMNSQPDAIVVQIHGYAEKNRKSPASRQADVIISSGQRWPHPKMLSLAACLQQTTDWQILRYPLDVGELGGTTNVQGQLMNSLGNPQFIHLELSSRLRKVLAHDEAALYDLAECIQSITPGAE